jgi:prophage tail gpP-like protein
MYSKLAGKDKDEMTLIIDDREIIIESGTLLKTMDTGADAFTAVIAWEFGKDPFIDRVTAPFSYSHARIYIGGDLISEQVLYKVTQETDNSGTKKTLEFASKTADIIDSTVIAPYEANLITLTDRCKQQCNPYGIHVFVGEDAQSSLNETRQVIVTTGYKKVRVTSGRYDPKYGAFGNYKLATVPIKKSKLVIDEKKFPRVTAKPTDTVFKHLSELAMQRGLLLSCTDSGDLLITKANLTSTPVGTIEESASPQSNAYIASFDGRNRYSQYRAIIKSSGKSRSQYTMSAMDKAVPTPRLLTFDASDDIPGGANKAALWRRNKTAADAMTVSFPVNSWYAPDNTIWKCNKRLTVISPTMGVKKGFTYLITSVEYKYDQGGSNATLQLKPPSVYETIEIEEPWLGGE